MNCSGKHAAMLATCVINGWEIENYLSPVHPLQVGMKAKLEELSGERIAFEGVDGCGAPVHALSLPALARLAQSAVTAQDDTPERIVADAMRAYPEYVAGPGVMSPISCLRSRGYLPKMVPLGCTPDLLRMVEPWL